MHSCSFSDARVSSRHTFRKYSQGWRSKSGCFASCRRSVVCTKPSDAGRQQSVVSNYIYVGCACRRRQKRHIWATNGVNGNTVKVIKGSGLNKTVLATTPKHQIYSRSIFRPFRNQGTSQSKWQSVTIFMKKAGSSMHSGLIKCLHSIKVRLSLLRPEPW